MADKRIIEQTASTTVPDDAFFIFDSALLGTFKISRSALLDFFGNATITEVTKAQYDALPDTKLTDGVLYAIKDQETSYVVDIEVNGSSILDEDGIAELATVATSGEAEDVSYDNTTSGLTATNVQDAIDETFENAGKVDDVKVDGTSVVTNKVAEIEIPVKDVQVKTDSAYDSVVDASGNAKIDLSSVTAYGEVPNLPQAIATFKDGADAPMKSLKVAIEPQQDLHGYDSPWVGGAGKNKCSQKITEFSYSNNAGGSSTVQGDTLVITTTSSLNSGVYSILDIVESFTGKCSYSVDVKANTNGDVLIGMTNAGRKTVSLTTSWQRIKFEDVTFDGNSKTFVIYSQGTANTIQVKNFMFELGSVAHDYEPYSNICPISGWSEANVTKSGKNIATTEIYKNNYVLADDGAENYAGGFIITKEIKINSSNNYYISMVGGQTSSSDAIRIGYFDGNFNFIRRENESSPLLLSVPDNAKYIRLSYRYIDPYFKDIQIEEGSTATTYEAYNGQTYTIDLDGTRYGGELDVVSGVLTVDRAYFKYTNVSTTSGTVVTDGWRCNFTCPIDDINRGKWSIQTDAIPIFNKISSVAKGYGANEYTVTLPNVTSKQEADAMLEGLEICYKLATPLTIQLTPTQVKSLLGQNNIWADTGDIDKAEYQRDATTIINELIARIEALEG